MKSAMWTVPPSVEGSVKSGALSPTFNLLDGGAAGLCANPADPYSKAATRDLLFMLDDRPSSDYDTNTKTHTRIDGQISTGNTSADFPKLSGNGASVALANEGFLPRVGLLTALLSSNRDCAYVR